MQRHSSSQRTCLVTSPGAQSLPGGLPGGRAEPLGQEEPLPAPSCSGCIPQAEGRSHSQGCLGMWSPEPWAELCQAWAWQRHKGPPSFWPRSASGRA